ncbi:MAG: hypothetical protein V3R83_09825 [Gammaproteobacteria bacterium]
MTVDMNNLDYRQILTQISRIFHRQPLSRLRQIWKDKILFID